MIHVDKMQLKEIIMAGKQGDIAAKGRLIEIFSPMLRKMAMSRGRVDEDCLQTLSLAFLKLIENFDPEAYIPQARK